MMQANVEMEEKTNARSLLSWPWAGLIVAFFVLIAIALIWDWGQAPPGEGSAEVNFARAMAAHHGQAVEMALILYNRSDNDELRTLALDILLTQQAQIGQMQGWLAIWKLPMHGLEPPLGENPHMMGMASQEDINALKIVPIKEAEVSFLQLMIRHHQGGVTMAEMVLKETYQPAVESLAQAVVSAQQSEIEYMTALLAQRDAQPLP